MSTPAPVAPPEPGALSRHARRTGVGFAIGFASDIGIQALTFAQNLIVPRLIGPGDYGLYALAVAVVSVGLSLREFGVHEKIVQEREADLPRSYSVAFTLEVAMATVLVLVALVAAPLVANAYDRPELVPVIAVLAFTIYSAAFANLPSALYLRRLEYGKRNLIAAVGPVTRFAVTVPLAFAGFGVYSLVAGAVAGLVASGVALAWAAPLRPRLHLERALVTRYLRYGWPLWVAGLLGIGTTVGGTVVVSGFLGIAALGYFSLAQRLAQQAFRLDVVLAQTILPVLARAQDDLPAQRRAFEITNRLTVLWAGPLGFGLAVLAEDLVHIVLGAAWAPAVFVFQMQGLAITLASIGYSWDVFFRARGQTRPTLAFKTLSEAWVLVVLLPAVAVGGLTGAAVAIACMGVIAVVLRQWFIRKLFPGVNLVANAWRELLATGSAALAVHALRRLLWAPQNLLGLVGLALLLLLLCAVFVVALDGRFLLALARRLRGDSGSADPPTAPSAPRAAPSAGTEVLDRLPGSFPFALTPAADGGLWCTFRDSSGIGRLDPATGVWRRWRSPAYPHAAAIDDRGRAWAALTLAGAVARYDPETGAQRRFRLGRSRELLGAAWLDGACVVVDSAHLRLWHVRDGARPRAERLPTALRRPDLLAVLDGALWLGDTAVAQLAQRNPDGSWLLHDVPDGTRQIVADGTALWLAHTARPLVSHFDTVTGELRSFTLPGVPFGLTVAGDGRAWAGLHEREALAAVDLESGEVELVPLPSGDQPVSLAWHADRLWVASGRSDRLLALDLGPLP